MARKKAERTSIDGWLAAWAKRVGAVEQESYDDKPEYIVETVVGKLRVKAIEAAGAQDGVWLACRFEDVDAAAKHFGVKTICQHRLNPYSGKFNFCEALGTDDGGAVAYMLHQFEREVGAVLKKRIKNKEPLT